MKTFMLGALALSCLLPLTPFTPLASAQTGGATIIGPDGEPAVITREGTVSAIGADGLIIRSENSPEPIRYRFRRDTTYLDDTGAPISIETVKSGLPVTVYYVRDGDQLIANRVVVRRQVTTSTSEPAPTVIERNTTITKPPVVVEKKVYVDRPVDRPVIVEKKVPVPVQVEKKVYVDRPVIVEKATPPQVLIEKKTTTTTTTTSGDK
jgi:hypothetical protein